MGKCSFGKVVVNDVFEAAFPFGTDLEGRLIYLQDGDKQWLMGSFDFSYMFRRSASAWRKGISDATGIPVSNIWYHDLQLHSAPTAGSLDGKPCERLVETCIPVVKEMISKAEEAEMSYVIANLDGQFNMNREQYIPELGIVTVWCGLKFDGEGRPYSQDPGIMLLGSYKPDVPAFEKPIYFDRPADPQGVLMVFRSKSGKILGTLSRFAAHPDVATMFGLKGIMEEYRYSYDWPGYIRNTLDREIGGTCMFANGPCGNLSVKKNCEGKEMDTYKGCDVEARRIGEGIANACIKEWKKNASKWEDIRIGGMVSRHINVPARDTIPKSREASINREKYVEQADKALQEAIDSKSSPARIKRLIDDKYHQQVINKIVNNWVGMSDEELAKGEVELELEAIRINDLLLAGLPGENLTETCQWLRAQSVGNRLVVFDQVNGYTCYMSTSESYDLGGYTYWCSWLTREDMPLIRNHALDLIKSANRGGW